MITRRSRVRVNLPIVGNSYERPQLCDPCGALCCKSFPGIPTPEQFGAPDREQLRINVLAALKTGRWCVNPDTQSLYGYEYGDFYLRPAFRTHENDPMVDHFQGPGTCTFLGDDLRCEIYASRPQGCRDLVPDAEPDDKKRCCTSIRGVRRQKIKEVDAWQPYEQLILDAADEAERSMP